MEKYKQEDWLREQYIEKNRSINKMGQEVGVSAAEISRQLHINGIRTGKRDEYKYICPDCNVPQKNPSQHLTKSDCKRPEISEIQQEMLKGLVMGDGSINHHSKNWTIQWGSINKEFMDWFNWRMEDIGIEVREVKRSLEEIRNSWGESYDFSEEEIKDMNFHKIFRWGTISHPEINTMFSEWLKNGKKKFPEGIEISPINLCIWYCGDGGLNWSGDRCSSARITTVNESENIYSIVSSLERVGLNPNIYQDEREGSFNNPHTHTSISFSGDGMEEFFDYIGSPPPGMEYKWETESRQKYNELLKNSKTEIEPVIKDSLFNY